METTTLQIRLSGDFQQVQASTALLTANGFIESLQKLITYSSDFQCSSDDISFKLGHTEDGSFVFNIIPDVLPLAFLYSELAANLPAYLRKAMHLYDNVLKLKLHIADGKPIINRVGEAFEVINNHGEVFTTDRKILTVASSKDIDENIGRTYRELDRDVSINSLEETFDGVTISQDRRSFKALARERHEHLEITEDYTDPNVELAIIKPSFDSSLKWTVMYRGKKVNVSITDDNFNNRIDNGEKFAKKDTLRVDLGILKKFSYENNVFIDSEYFVRAVHDHMHEDKVIQKTIDLS